MRTMKRNILMGLMSLGFVFAAGAIMPPAAEAFYADDSSAVYQGKQNGYSFYAVNVVDDDGTVYTFYYRLRRATDDIAWRTKDDLDWRYWETGKHVQYTHMEQLAQTGFESVKQLL